MIKAIIFDFAGVIATESFIAWLNDTIVDFKNTKQTYFDLSYRADSAQISEKEFAMALSERSGVPTREVWPQIFQRVVINDEMIALLTKLKRNYKIGLLTNHIEPWITQIIEHYRLAQYFDSVVISSQEKIIKPDPRIYKIMLQRLGVKASEALFIDDRQINVDGAINAGLHSVLFYSEKQLHESLKKYYIET
jgi:epoxide hydrolase-like predicted phosphatase